LPLLGYHYCPATATRGSRLLQLFGLFQGSLLFPRALETMVECVFSRCTGPRPRRRHSTTPERVVSMPGRGHDDEPDLPARTRTRKPEGKAARPDALLAQLQSGCP
jgi:hypothetical protein